MSRQMRRILIIGRSGQVAQAVGAALKADGRHVEILARPHLDLRDPLNCIKTVRAAEPDLVVNCGAFTNVEEAESDPRQALLINATGAQAVARGAAAVTAPIIHFSTDYVFDGHKGCAYIEGDTPNPASVYGKSKFAGDILVASANAAHVILRTAWIFSPRGRNFVRAMMHLARERAPVSVVCDQIGCPTSAQDIGACIRQIVDRLEAQPSDRKLFGLFNLANSGQASWFQFAQAIMQGLDERGEASIKVDSIPSHLYQMRAPRPAYSVLCLAKLKSVYGITTRPWQEALDECLDAIVAQDPTYVPAEQPLAESPS